jgi:hypothetical protein
VSIQETWLSTLRQHGESDDPNWVPSPGDAVCDIADPKGTFGLIIAVLPKQNDRLKPSFWLKALVLWTRELQQDTLWEMLSNNAKQKQQINDEIDRDLLLHCVDHTE